MNGEREVSRNQVSVSGVAEQMRTGLVTIHHHICRQVDIVEEAESALKSGLVIAKERKVLGIVMGEG